MSHTNEQVRRLRDALRVVLDHVGSTPGGTFSEAGLVHGVVEEFGNGGSLWGPLLTVPGLPAAVSAPIPGHGSKRPTSVRVLGHGADLEAARQAGERLSVSPSEIEAYSAIDRAHAQFRAALREIVDGKVSRETAGTVAAARERVVQVCSHYLPESLDAALAYVLDLLLDPAKGYGADLRACQYIKCDRFFFVTIRPREPGKENVGVRPDRYCCPDHAKKAHNIVKANWTKERRKELKRQREERGRRLAGGRHK